MPLGAALILAAGFSTETLADGVVLLRRTDPPGLMFEANAVLLVNDEDVVVVDGGSNPASAREVLSILRGITSKPVRTVIDTHWHDDHVAGHQVWKEAFPGVEFVAHAASREDLGARGVENRRQFREGAPGYVEFLKRLVAEGVGLDGGPLSDEERTSHLSSIALAEKALAQAHDLRVIPPTLTFEDRITLQRGERRIEVRFLGRAHTRGDVVVHLPEEGIAVAGDLVSWPVPLVGSTSFPLDYPATLGRLLDLRARLVVPGHGPALRDDRYLRLVLATLTALKERTAVAVARGETLEQARASVDLAPFRKKMAGDSPVAGILFDQYVAGPGIARAWEMARSPWPDVRAPPGVSSGAPRG